MKNPAYQPTTFEPMISFPPVAGCTCAVCEVAREDQEQPRVFPALDFHDRTEAPQEAPEAEPEYTGGSVGYYTVHIASPTTEGNTPYDAECNDIIEALGMNYAEGNAFKALWRRAAARLGKAKKGYTDGLYDAEKVVFFGTRLVVQELTKNRPE